MSWAMQGAAMAVGKFVHGRTQELTARWGTFAEQKVQLIKRARAQEALARQVEQSGGTEAALQLLEQHVRLLHDEHVWLQDPAEIARLGLDEAQMGVLRAGNDAALADTHSQSFEIMRLRFHGLEPIAGNGLLWSGTRAHIEAALAETGATPTSTSTAGRMRWTAQIGGRGITFVEIEPTCASGARRPGAEPSAHDSPAGSSRDAGRIERVPQQGDDGHEYHYDQMHPGPLSDRQVYDPHDQGVQLPAQGFYGAKYDVVVLPEDAVFYRVGNADREWGEWFTDHPIQSEAQYRIDLAVKREWPDPRTGEMPPNSARPTKQLELWSYTIVIPKGTTVYSGQVASQGGVFMGGLGPGSKQYFIPKAWTLQAQGGKVIAKAPFQRDGHVQPAASDLHTQSTHDSTSKEQKQ
jgi:hypothetical protein